MVLKFVVQVLFIVLGLDSLRTYLEPWQHCQSSKKRFQNKTIAYAHANVATVRLRFINICLYVVKVGDIYRILLQMRGK